MASELDRPFRPRWDDYFMAGVRILATRSSCNGVHGGGILVKDKGIIFGGYNGAPPGMETCDDVGHLMEEGHCVRTIHGEHNAILQASALGGVSTKGSTMYSKYNPCIHCAKYVIAAGIIRVVVGKLYRGEAAVDFLRKANIQVDIYEPNLAWNNYISDVFTHDVLEVKTTGGDVKVSVEKS